MKKALVVMVLLLLTALFLVWQNKPTNLQDSKQPYLLVTTFALYDLASAVAGDKMSVEMLIPFGVDVHGFEPTPKDMVRLDGAELFIYSGAGLEPWAHNLGGSRSKLDISHAVSLVTLEDASHEEHEAHEGACEHHHGAIDPHYWLDPYNMISAAEEVAMWLGEHDPDNAAYYGQRKEAYTEQMKRLDKMYRERLHACTKHSIVVNHNAFGYLAKRYGFEVHAISALSPEAMPSAKTMAALSDLIEHEEVGVIFFESFVSDRLIKSLAEETGAVVDVLQPLANITAEEAQHGVSYVGLMEENLAKLSKAMECR